MSVEAVSWALSVPVGGNPKLLLIGLANHAHADGTESYPSLDKLASYAYCDRSTARRNVRKLVEDGWIAEDGLGPKGQTKYRLNMGGQNATGGKLPRVANPPKGGGTAMPPEPSLEPSSSQQRAPARERIPEGFPDDLRLHGRVVAKILRDLAERTPRAKAVSMMALGNVIMARPYKPLVKSAYDYVAWHESKSSKHTDLVSGYRNWLDRTDDLAAYEPLTEDGRPVPGAGSTSGRGPRMSAKDERLVSARERARAAWNRRQSEEAG